jgi:hypothetical protein
MRIQKFAEIIKQLVGCKVVNPAIKVVSDTPDSPRIGVNGFWLESFESQTFQVFLVIVDKLWIIWYVNQRTTKAAGTTCRRAASSNKASAADR